eukprot:m.82537 g.82537  ORF g.82537 m.82537 type:complete len:254 (-) comp12692_c0_seq7:286-1047(-)
MLSSASEAESDNDSDEEQDGVRRSGKRQVAGRASSSVERDGDDGDGPGAKKSKDDGFEEVAAEGAPAEGLDAHGLALATEMFVRRKKRELIDAAYNRYAHNDSALPAWFNSEEEEHLRPTMPITKEMVNEIRERERELNARPIKKVMEAKARKKMKTQRLMTKLNTQAEVIANNDSLTEREKGRQIEKLYGQMRRQNQQEKMTLVRARKATAQKRPQRPKGMFTFASVTRVVCVWFVCVCVCVQVRLLFRVVD